MIGVVLAAAVGAFAATPESAALQAVYRPPSAPVRVVRVNRAGHFATVLIQGAVMEGSPVRNPVFLEHFSFGWQPLSLINSSCDMRDMQVRAGVSDAARLMAGIPAPERDRGKCPSVTIDRGPAADILAIRAQMRGPLVPYVLVSRAWALAEWYGAGGGSTLFHRVNGRWARAAGGGGSMDLGILRGFGVPAADACRLRPGLAVRSDDAKICGSP